jgi:DNA-binding PadR family transcriptional regulator
MPNFNEIGRRGALHLVTSIGYSVRLRRRKCWKTFWFGQKEQEMIAIGRQEIGGLRRRGQGAIPLLDDPPMGHLQAVVLRTIARLGKDAYGYNVLETLCLENKCWLDHSQIYQIIRRLIKEKGYIELAETRKQASGAPLKIYRLTPDGKAALKACIAHHRATLEYLSGK